MKRSGIFLFLLLLISPLQAQMYKWTDANGKVQYSDKPPPAGAQATPLKNRSSSVTAPPEASPTGVKGMEKIDAKTSATVKSTKPLTTAEQEQAFRKRKLDDEEGQKKSQEKLALETKKQENCANSKGNLITMESGTRQARVDAKGERYFLDDAQIQAEVAKARQQVNTFCN